MKHVKRQPMVIGIRMLVRVLQREAEKVWRDRRMQRLMAEIAARDLISAGRVRVAQAGRRRMP